MNRNLAQTLILATLVLTSAIGGAFGCHRSAEKRRPATNEPTILTMTFAGDLGLGLAVEADPWIEKNGYRAAFTHLCAVIKDTDFFIANLECPIVEPDMPTVFGKRRPRQPPEVAKVLKDEGVSIVSLANNHLMDYGKPGLDSTLRHLREAGVQTFGAGDNLAQASAPLIVEKNGYKVAVVAGCRPRKWPLLATTEQPGVAPLTKSHWRKNIANARSKADFVVALPHWGKCYKKSIVEEQTKYAKLAVAAGAGLVVGHHPHIPQQVEIIDRVPVLHSIGNFLYHGVRRSKPDRTLRYDYSWVTKVEWSRQGLKSITITPFFNNNLKVDFTPRPAAVKNARRVFNKFLPTDGWEQVGNTAVLRFP